MSGFRKFIGVFIIAFIGIPALFAAIWGVGLTRAVVSKDFLGEFPREIIEKLPQLLDESLELAIRKGEFDSDESQWIKAIAAVETSPQELLEKIGIMNWLKNEATQALDDLGKTLRGERPPRPIILNLRPLKQALKHEGLTEYIKNVLQKLPPCTTSQTAIWVDASLHHSRVNLPPCQPPGFEQAIDIIRYFWNEKIDEIPDEVDIFNIDEDEDFFPFKGIEIARLAVTLSYFLFLIPTLFIFLGAWIGGGTGSRILRWSGISALIGGLLSFILIKFTGAIMEWAMKVGPTRYSDYPLDEMGEAFAEKMINLVSWVMEKLFAPVNTVAGMVCIIGIILIALSYTAVREDRPTSSPHKKTTPSTGTPNPMPPVPTTPSNNITTNDSQLSPSPNPTDTEGEKK